MSSSVRPLRQGRGADGVLLLLFLVSRIAYFLAGVRFDAEQIPLFFQVIDLDLLRNRLGESLLYLHIQPPGFNLLIGSLLKLFPDSYAFACQVLYLAFSLATGFLLLRLMRGMGMSSTLALVLTSLYLVSPGVVLFENYPLYETPIVFLITLAAYSLFRYFETRALWWSAGFMTSLLLLLSIRNFFHLFYCIAAAAALLYFSPGRRRALAVICAVPLLLALSIFVKNWILFGHFDSSTWLGMNAHTITLHNLTPEESQDLVSRNLISPMSLLAPGEPLEAYKPYIHPWPQPTGVPLMDMEKSSTGVTNFNNTAFLSIRQIYIRDALTVLREKPQAYFRSVQYAWFAYFLPTTDFPFFERNRPPIQKLERIVNLVVFGQFKSSSQRTELRSLRAAGASVLSLALYTGTFLMVGLPAVWLFGVKSLWNGVRMRTLTTPQIALLFFIVFNVTYLTAISNFLSSFETNRYRFQVDGFWLLLAGLALNRLHNLIAPSATAPAESSVKSL